MGINIPIMEAYGMSESTVVQTMTSIHNWRLGSVGQCLSGTYLKIDNPNENGEGEVRDRFCLISFMTVQVYLPCRSVCMVAMCSWAT